MTNDSDGDGAGACPDHPREVKFSYEELIDVQHQDQ